MITVYIISVNTPGGLDDPYHDVLNLEFKPALHSMFIIILIIMIKEDVLRHNDSILFFCKLKNEILKELTPRKVRPNANYANGNILNRNI